MYEMRPAGNSRFHKLKDLAAKHREILSYLIVGGLTTVVSLGTYYICIYTVFDPANPLMLQSANILSWILAVTFAYFANRKYVFQSRNPDIFREAASFYAGRVGTLLLDMGFMGLFVSVLGLNAYVTKLIGQVVITIANYVISKLWVFRRANG